MTTSLNNSSQNVDNSSTTSKDEDTQMTKKQLLEDIQHLKRRIKKSEKSLNTVFKDVESVIESRDSRDLRFSRMPDIETKLKDDLYKFAGFRSICLKKGEIIFNFTSVKDKQKENTQAIQIFIKDGKGYVGKWVMPMMVDINYMLKNINIENLKNIPPFIKSCKYNIDCYTLRQEQFLSLKASISDIKYCTLESNMEYTQVNLELYGIHNIKDDIHVNLVIYLSYHSDQVIPYNIEVDTTDKRKLSEDEREILIASLKPFKKSDLQTAFDKILIEDGSAFARTRTEDSESTLELSDTSVSDEESLSARMQSKRRRLSKRIQSKRELQKKQNEKLKQRKTKTKNASMNYKHSNTKASDIGRNINNLSERTPTNKSKTTMKQTKLNFQTVQATKSNIANKNALLKSRFRNKKPNRAKLLTSTPLHPRTRNINSSSSSNLDTNNITEIEAVHSE